MKIKIGLLCLCMFLLAGCDPASITKENTKEIVNSLDDITHQVVTLPEPTIIEEADTIVTIEETKKLTIADDENIETSTTEPEENLSFVDKLIAEINFIQHYNYPKVGEPYTKVESFLSSLSYFNYSRRNLFIEDMYGNISKIIYPMHFAMSNVHDIDYDDSKIAIEEYNKMKDYCSKYGTLYPNGEDTTRWECHFSHEHSSSHIFLEKVRQQNRQPYYKLSIYLTFHLNTDESIIIY